MRNILKTRTQWVWLVIIVVVTAISSGLLLWSDKATTTAEADQDSSTHKQDQQENEKQGDHGEVGHVKGEQKQTEAEDAHGVDAEKLTLTNAQMQQQNIKLAQVALGEVIQVQTLPAKLVVNTDRQAHISPSFSGRVESVYVALGQSVKRGQALAKLWVPDLVDQQTNLQIAQSNLALAQQDYARESSLWSQGISAKQDYQRAYNTYRQAQIQVRAARSRLTAYGAGSSLDGLYTLTAPINGVISQKDIVMGENVQLDDQLFTIDQLDQLWLEFVMPSTANVNVQPNQQIRFKSLQTGNLFNAQIQSLSTEADAQTGRLLVRAKVLSSAAELRPNLMVNVELEAGSKQSALRVSTQAIQQVEGKDSVFVATADQNKGFDFVAVPVRSGQRSQDGQWLEITHGLTVGQRYVVTGSFLLKSELEKGEAEHGH